MASMATETSSSIVPASGQAPSSWGLGDGQAIPWEYAPAPESRDIVTIKERYGLFIGGRFVPAEGRRHVLDRQPGDRRDAGAGREGQPGRRRSAPSAPRAAPRPDRGARSRARNAPSTCSGSPASCRSGAASSPSSNRWTRASRSRRAATSTSRSRRPTSGTTPAGRTSSSTRSRGASRGRSASPRRSSRGTSRC